MDFPHHNNMCVHGICGACVVVSVSLCANVIRWNATLVLWRRSADEQHVLLHALMRSLHPSRQQICPWLTTSPATITTRCNTYPLNLWVLFLEVKRARAAHDLGEVESM